MLRLVSYTNKCNCFFTYGFQPFKQIPHRYSTLATIESKPINSPSSLTTFLIHSLGFSEQKALSTSTKLSTFRKSRRYKVSNLTSFTNPNSVITFLEQIGLAKSQIRELVCIAPQILTARVETLEPKIAVLQELGLYGSNLAEVILANPAFLHRALDSVIVPAIQSLRAVLGSDQNVILILNKRSSWIFSCDYIDNLLPNVALLEKYGVSREKIRKHVVQHPRAFMVKSEVFSEILVRVEEKWGIPRLSKMFLYGVQLLAWQSDKTLESKCEVYKSFGWSESDIVAIVRKNPNCLVLSEARIKSSLVFLMKELDYGPEYLATHPSLLTYSLDKRLVPRHRILMVLKEKGLLSKNYPFYSVVTLTEPKFVQKFVLPFEEVHDDYTKYMEHTVEQLTQGKSNH